MNNYTLQRRRTVNEVVDEVVIIPEDKLREIFEEAGIDFEEFDDLNDWQFQDVWDYVTEAYDIISHWEHGEEYYTNQAINEGETFTLNNRQYNPRTLEDKK